MAGGVGKRNQRSIKNYHGMSDSQLLTDVWIHIAYSKSESVLKYKQEWFVDWDTDNKEQRTIHRAWIKLYVQGYLKDQADKIRRELKNKKEYRMFIMKADDGANYKELCMSDSIDREKLLSIINESCIGDIDDDMLNWRMDMITCEALLLKHNMSRRTLYRRWDELKMRIVANATAEGLI